MHTHLCMQIKHIQATLCQNIFFYCLCLHVGLETILGWEAKPQLASFYSI